MIKGLTTLALTTLLLGGCAARTSEIARPSKSPARSPIAGKPSTRPALARSIPIPPGDDNLPVIVHIVRHDRVLTVKSGPDGLLYSMRGEKDEILLADATEAQFEQANPQLYRELRHYMAVQADASSAVRD
ncbi:MAG: hypothetical protein H0T11_04835 [Chthoniobacterales bacterium]|nr:hypothetical protein [Chthoniobacterales bacterium]